MTRQSDEARRDDRRRTDRDDSAADRDRDTERRQKSPWPLEPVLHDA